MTNERRVIYFLILACAFASAFRLKPSGASRVYESTPTSDTSAFAPNTAKGWSILSSYLNQDTPDSMAFELILKQDNSLTWATEQFIGTITNQDFFPKRIQKLSYDLYRDNSWSVTITSDGLCYLNQLKGEVLKISSLPGNPFVLPVKVRYRNK